MKTNKKTKVGNHFITKHDAFTNGVQRLPIRESTGAGVKNVSLGEQGGVMLHDVQVFGGSEGAGIVGLAPKSTFMKELLR